MNQTEELLREIYKNAELAKEILGKLIKLCKDASFRNVLADQFAEYHSVIMEAGERLTVMGVSPKGVCSAARRPIYAGVCFNARIDNTPSHLAEMLIQGGTLGLVDAARAINGSEGAEKSAIALAERLRTAEEANIRQLLKFV